jgi:hypothetical protein
MWIRIQVRTEETDPKTDPHCGCGYQSCTADPQILTPVEDPDPHPRPICERARGKMCQGQNDDFYGAQISVMLGTEPDVIHTVAVNDQKCHFLPEFLHTLSGSIS